MRVADIMTREVQTTSGDRTFEEAARTLRDHRISSVVVLDGDAPVGIVTERDIVALVAEGGDARAATLSDRMSRDLVTISSRSDVTDAARLMEERGIRHLPVVDRNRLIGIVSIRDLTGWAVEEMTGEHELPDLERSSAALRSAQRARNQS